MVRRARQITQLASDLSLGHACGKKQLLLSLSKNGTEWLSPMGWTSQQKSTLLECTDDNGATRIVIPPNYAADIEPGDVLVFSCATLDLKETLVWQADRVKANLVGDIMLPSKKIGSGLFACLAAMAPGTSGTNGRYVKRDTAKAKRDTRADIKKMRATAAAKESAYSEATLAARHVEAARLAQVRQLRLEVEKSERRLAIDDEKRREEEYRQRDIAVAEKLARQKAIERYTAALEKTRDEELRLDEHLQELKLQEKEYSKALNYQDDNLKASYSKLQDSEAIVEKRIKRFENSEKKRNAEAKKLSTLQTESDVINAQHRSLPLRLSLAEEDFQRAQQAVIEAEALASERQAELDALKAEKLSMAERLTNITEKLHAQAQLAESISEKTLKLQTVAHKSRAELQAKFMDIDRLKQQKEINIEHTEKLHFDIETTRQAIAEIRASEKRCLDGIIHLKQGGALESIPYDIFERHANSTVIAPEQSRAAAPVRYHGQEAKRHIGHSLKRSGDKVRSINPSDLKIKLPRFTAFSYGSLSSARLKMLSPQLRFNGMALGATIAGIFILSGGFAINQKMSLKNVVKTQSSVTTQVASDVISMQLPVKANSISNDEETLKYIEEPETADLELLAKKSPSLQASEPETQTLAAKPEKLSPPASSKLKLEDKADVTPKASIQDESGTPEDGGGESLPKQNKSPEIIQDVQMRLADLGFYKGAVHGVKTRETVEAVILFKTLFDMDADDEINTQLVKVLKQAQASQKVDVEAAGILKKSNQISAPLIAEFSKSNPSIMRLALPDNVVPARSISNSSPRYPEHAWRNGYFEREAVRFVRELRYSPKTLNGRAIVSERFKKRIFFRP